MAGSYQELPSGTVYVHDFGGQGNPILAVHGLGGSHLNWMPVAAGLTTTGRLVAPDLPGFGYSPPRRSYSVTNHALAMVELLDSFGGPAILIGNSLGGLVSIEVAAKRPDLVESLVLVAPAAPPRLDDPRLDRVVARRLILQGTPLLGPAMINKYLRSTTPEIQLRDTLAVVCAQPQQIPAELLAPSLQLAAARRRQPWAVEALVSSGRSAAAMLARRKSLARKLDRIQAPTLIVQGGKDRVISGSGVEWLAEMRPDWDWVVMSNTGHCPQLEAAEQFVGVYQRWLERALVESGS